MTPLVADLGLDPIAKRGDVASPLLLGPGVESQIMFVLHRDVGRKSRLKCSTGERLSPRQTGSDSRPPMRTRQPVQGRFDDTSQRLHAPHEGP